MLKLNAKKENKLTTIEFRESLDDSIKKLSKKFFEIRSMGYIKSIRRGSTGIGATFEALLGKNEDKSELPDFEGIELKTRRGYSKSLINLFNARPKGETEYEVKRIRDTYGYPDKNDKKLKIFFSKIGANVKTKVGVFYRFQLRVDREQEKVFLCVYDWNDFCIDESTYWDFLTLREKMVRKLGILALIKAWPNRIDGVEYFKYYKMSIYILRDFDNFLTALDNGKIKVSFKIGNHYNEEKYGMVHSHGVGFTILEDDLDCIFERYR